MGDKVAITVALAGGLTQKGEGKGMTPYLPITPDEMAEEAKRCHDAGASIVHIHARDPKTGQAVPDLNLYREIVEKTRAKSPILINITTGGGVDQTLDERLAPIPALQPDMASYTSGSLSYGLYSKSQKKFIYDIALGLPYSELLRFAKTMLENGTKPECEIYCHSMLNNIRIVEQTGLFNKPIHMQFVMGMPGQVTPSTPKNLMHLLESAKEMFAPITWSVCAVGLDQWPIITLGAILGAENIRTGMEDNIYLEKGVLAKSNAEMVEKAVELARGVGRQIASVEEAREILHIG
jgi:3-keto-5-aminohexanoate cleavage enzyme